MPFLIEIELAVQQRMVVEAVSTELIASAKMLVRALVIPEIARFERTIRKWTLPVAVSLSYAINKLFSWTDIITNLGSTKEVVEIISFFCLTIICLFFEDLLANCAKIGYFRRFLLRNNFFEGTWVEIIRANNSAGKVIELAVTFIIYDGQAKEYMINGYGKRVDTDKVDHYYSLFTRSNPLKLEYCWKWSTSGRDNYAGYSIFTRNYPLDDRMAYD